MTKKSDIVIDLTKITKRQVMAWQRARREIIYNEDGTERRVDPWTIEEHDFSNLYALVIVSWPYGPVDFETYLDLPLPDSRLVDKVVMDAMSDLSEKK